MEVVAGLNQAKSWLEFFGGQNVKEWLQVWYNPFLRRVVDKYSRYDDYVSLLVKPHPVAHTENHEEAVTVQDALESERAIYLVGRPGSGKTCVLDQLLIETAKRSQFQKMGFDSGKPILPVYVEALRGDVFDQILLFLHVHGLSKRQMSKDWLLKALGKGGFLILVDDVHKLLISEKSWIASGVPTLLKYRDLNKIVLAGRDHLMLNPAGLKTFELARLTLDKQKEVLHLHSPDESEADQLYSALEGDTRLQHFYDTPQMLAFLAQAHRHDPALPRRKTDLFRSFHTWRHEKDRDRWHSSTNIRFEEQVLGHLALGCFVDTHDPYRASEETVLKLLHGYLQRMQENTGIKRDSETVYSNLLTVGELVEKNGWVSFRHDQWQEYFAACELVRVQERLSVVTADYALREVALFAAGLCTPEKDFQDRTYWALFWEDLVQRHPFYAFECLKLSEAELHVDNARPYVMHMPGGENIRAAYEQYLANYTYLLDNHFYVLRERIPPYTAGRIGLLIERDDRVTKIPFLQRGHWFGYREISAEDELVVVVDRTAVQQTYGGTHSGNLLHYLSQYDVKELQSWPLDPALHQPPARGAIQAVARYIMRLVSNNNLWEPNELVQEQAYCEAAVLVQYMGNVQLRAEGETTKSTLADPKIEVAKLRSVCEEIRTRFAKQGVPLFGLKIEGKGGLKSRRIGLGDIERSLNTYCEMYPEAEFIEAPLRRNVEVLDPHRTEPLSNLEKAEIEEWFMQYYPKLYTSMLEMLERNFPKMYSTLRLYGTFPIRILLCWEIGETYSKHVGRRYVFRGVEGQLQPVQVEIARLGDMERIRSTIHSGREFDSGWHLDVMARREPLREAVYADLKRELDHLLKR